MRTVENRPRRQYSSVAMVSGQACHDGAPYNPRSPSSPALGSDRKPTCLEFLRERSGGTLDISVDFVLI